MAQLGFIALVNRTFVYLFVSLIALPILIVTSGNLVFSMLIAPLIYFGWQMIVSVSERVAKIVELLGPRDYSATMGNVGCILVIIHWAVWVLPYITVFLLALVVRFGLDLPLTYLSEKLVAPLVMRVYKRAARIVAEEKKWKIKHTAFVGSILILFGFLYQFIATVMLIKW